MHSTPFDHLPLKNPGNPELASVARFLLWIIRGQKRVLATGTFFGVVNLLSLAILPGVLGHGIQAIADDNQESLKNCEAQ